MAFESNIFNLIYPSVWIWFFKIAPEDVFVCSIFVQRICWNILFTKNNSAWTSLKIESSGSWYLHFSILLVVSLLYLLNESWYCSHLWLPCHPKKTTSSIVWGILSQEYAHYFEISARVTAFIKTEDVWSSVPLNMSYAVVLNKFLGIILCVSWAIGRVKEKILSWAWVSFTPLLVVNVSCWRPSVKLNPDLLWRCTKISIGHIYRSKII